VIETARLILRAPRDADREPLAALNADPRVNGWLGGMIDRAASDAGVDRQLEHFARHGFGAWVLERRSDRAVLGLAGLSHAPDDLPTAPAIEIGWRLAHHAWGQGYATEAARAALDHGFGALHLDTVLAWTAEGNLASHAVMGRIGMTPLPSSDFDHPGLAPGHPLRRHRVFRITRPAAVAGGET
jgi:RimJ/RimL family protein N-acetyltransferase